MSTTINKNKDGYGYKYTDIAEIHRFLEENNMSYYQYIERIDQDDYIMTVKIIKGEEKPAIRGSRVVNATLSGIKNPAQEQGSALTYARRYSLLMAFGLATEDDDAQSLTKKTTNKTTQVKSDDVLNVKLKTGKNAGKTWLELCNTNLAGVEYLANEGKNDFAKKVLEQFNKQQVQITYEEYEEVNAPF